MFRDDDNYIGKLVGNTGEPNKLTIALRTSFSARRGEFVRVAHQERESESQLDVLGRIVGLSRSNILFSPALGEGISEVELLPQSRLSGETMYATLELVGYKDPFTGEIRIPRRPLTPGTKVYGVDYAFLTSFYEFSEDTSIHLGNLVGYEKGENIVPVFLDANTLVTEHLAVLAMTGSGKSYTVGRVIERLVSQLNASVVVFDPHGEYGKAFRAGKLNFNDRLDRSRILGTGRSSRRSKMPSSSCRTAGAASRSTRRSCGASTRSTRGRTCASLFSSTTSTWTSFPVCSLA